MDRSKSIFSKMIILFFVGIIVFCGIKIGQEYKEYWGSYKQSVNASHKAGRDKKTVDFNALQGENPELVAWLYGKDTRIDYPVAQTTNNSKYLDRAYNGKSYSVSGTLFIDNRNKSPFNDDFVTIIYGHHMKDGSMFGTLADWRKKEVYDKCKKFYLYTPDQKYRLDIVSTNTVQADDPVYELDLYRGNQEKQDLIEHLLLKSEITSTESTVSINDRYVVLSTCSYEFNNARAIVVCKVTPVSDDEVVSVDEGNKEDAGFIGFIKVLGRSIVSFFKEGFSNW